MHALSSSYQNNSALNIPNDHPFRSSLPPRLHITADGDILSAVTDKYNRRHAAIVDGLAMHSPTADLIDLEDMDLLPSMRPTSVLSVTSTSSWASTSSSTASVISASTTSNKSDVSRNSAASTSKLVRTLGGDPFCNLNSENPETVTTTLTPHCLSPCDAIKAIISRTSRTSKT